MTRLDTFRDERHAKFVKLIDMLLPLTFSVHEVAAMTNTSASGARKYIRVLIGAGIVRTIEQTNAQHPGPLLHEVCGDEAAIAQFLASLAVGYSPLSSYKTKAPVTSTTRHIHLMQDDAPYYAKTVKKIPAPDPILAALFGKVAA